MQAVIIGLIIFMLVVFIMSIVSSDSPAIRFTDISMRPCDEAKPVPKPKKRVIQMWVYRRDPNQLWITQALCPRCGGVNASHTDLRLEDEKKRFEKKHRFCFICGKLIMDDKTSL